MHSGKVGLRTWAAIVRESVVKTPPEEQPCASAPLKDTRPLGSRAWNWRKELEPCFRNVLKDSKPILESGRPLKKFGNMLPRELVANWLLTVVGNFFTRSERFQFTTDPRGGDGIIYDTISAEGIWTEHVIVRAASPGDRKDVQSQILQAVTKKIAKGGPAYARGKTLIVFMFSGGDGAQWWPDKVAAALPRPLHFEAVWVVGFQRFAAGDRIYAVTRLDLRRGHAPAWWVRIASDFSSWVVSEHPPSAEEAA